MELKERVRGALLGLACGDALGAPAEFKSQAQVKAQFGVLRDMVGGGVWNPGEWTDDTGMALCVAEGILKDPNNPVPHIGERFLDWAQSSKDVGATCAAAIRNFRVSPGMGWNHAAQNTAAAKTGKAAGNGSLMRTLPVALAYRNSADIIEKSAEISAMTHWDAQAEICCAIYCLWLDSMLYGVDATEAWERAISRTYDCGALIAPGETDERSFWQRLEDAPRLRYEQLQPSGYAGYCVETLEAAVWCVLNTSSYEDAMVKAVNLAGEADTIAAVAGGAAGAFYGESSIPSRWLDALYRRDDLDVLADALYELRRLGAGAS